MPFADDSNAVPPEAHDALRIEGQVLDGEGVPVSDALLEAWHDELFARCRTDEEGAFHFTVRKPTAEHGSAPYLNLTVFARGLLRHLNTRIYFADEGDANRSDPVLLLVEPGRRHTLLAQADGDTLHFDVRLQGDGETVFFAV
jgi:protocatechuate 3,4-dioxygenase alpha subunit